MSLDLDWRVMPGRQRSLISLAMVAAVVVVVLLLARDRPADIIAENDAPDAEDTTERCLERMLDAARAGDLEAYLDCFGGPLHQRLAEEIAAQPRDAASAELRSGEADLKSFVTHPLEPPHEGEAAVTLERIYSRRHDVQRVKLRKQDGEWKIVELVPADRVAPPIRYGTPVVPEAGNAAIR